MPERNVHDVDRIITPFIEKIFPGRCPSALNIFFVITQIVFLSFIKVFKPGLYKFKGIQRVGWLTSVVKQIE